MKPKLRYRPRCLGSEFWPAHDHPELEEGFVDMPGGDLVIRGRLKLNVQVNEKGWPSEISSDFLAYRPDVKYTFPTCYGMGAADALGAIDAAHHGEDVVDLYFLSVREGFTDEEYSKQLAELGLPNTKGRFVIRWDPKKVEVPPVVIAASKGREELEAFLRRANFERTHATAVDSTGGSWVVPRGTRR